MSEYDDEQGNDGEAEDMLAAQRAAIDQFEKAAPELARLNWSIYSSHVEQGFSPNEALVITQQMLAIIMQGML